MEQYIIQTRPRIIMKDPQFQEIWHALNEACVCVVLACDEVPVLRRNRLVLALEAARKAEMRILEVLSERSAE